MNLKTVYITNMPVECHILKGRLDSEGVTCFIFDENMVWVHPFRSVAIGGVKLKVPENQFVKAKQILQAIQTANLVDDSGTYSLDDAFNGAMEKENEILRIKSLLRHNPGLLDHPEKIEKPRLNEKELAQVVESEKTYLELLQKDKSPGFKELLYELTMLNFDALKNLRPNPTEYYREKEDVENFTHQTREFSIVNCPRCNSKNVRFDDAIDDKWDIPYLLLSMIIATPFPPIRHKYHCFSCGYNFKRKHRKHS